MTEPKSLKELLQKIIDIEEADFGEMRPDVGKLAQQALDEASEFELLRSRNEYLEAQFQVLAERQQAWQRQATELSQQAQGEPIVWWDGSTEWNPDSFTFDRTEFNEVPLYMHPPAPAAVPVATIQAPDPEEERVGFWLSLSDKLRLAALPVGTKLYTNPPAPPEGWRLVPVEPQQGQQECAAFNLCNDYGPDYVMEHRVFALDSYRYLVLTAPKYMEPTK